MEKQEIEFVMIKPEGIAYAPLIKLDIRSMGLDIIAKKGEGMPYYIPEEKIKRHYEEHIGKEYFGKLMEQMQEGPVIAYIVKGENAISKIRSRLGHHNPNNAEKGTWRELFGNRVETHKNCVHASDSTKRVINEIEIHFDKNKLKEKLSPEDMKYISGL